MPCVSFLQCRILCGILKVKVGLVGMKLVHKKTRGDGAAKESRWNLASAPETTPSWLIVGLFNRGDLDAFFKERETRVSQPVGAYAD